MARRPNLVERLRAIGIYNDWELVKRFGVEGRAVYCSYSVGRGELLGPRTSVVRPGFSTDPHAHHLDRGNKAFPGARAHSLPLALAWATERYKVPAWASSPFGGYGRVPAEALEAAKLAADAAAVDVTP